MEPAGAGSSGYKGSADGCKRSGSGYKGSADRRIFGVDVEIEALREAL